MGIRISHDEARARLAVAVEWAKSEKPVPQQWVQLAEKMQEAPSKTYTPALGTALLAKATDPQVDALSIKEDYSANAYSQRTLCHSVLVPEAVKYGFSIRNTKREPLNNQPFFRFDHINSINRVHSNARMYLEELRFGLTKLNNSKDAEEPLAALAAFLRVRFRYLPELIPLPEESASKDVDLLIQKAASFLNENINRPHRTQALAAAAFAILYRKVKTRGLNDPSRDFPGDVQALAGNKAIMSAEVRAKRVPETEVRSFVTELRNAQIQRGFVVVIHPSHEPLPRTELVEWAWSAHRVVLTLLESTDELLRETVRWADHPVQHVAELFLTNVYEQLVEIEAPRSSLEGWRQLFN